MARPKAVIDAALAEKAEAALKALPEGKVCIRLKAIISSARYPIILVSSVFGPDRTTLWRWIRRFASKGVAGLTDEAKGHKPTKLGTAQRPQAATWWKEGCNRQGTPIFWTLQKLMLAIETEFGISLGQTAPWDLVRQMGFKQKAPRPRHAKADKPDQESFQKNLGGSERLSCFLQ